jgi:hypothetical protein
MAIIASDEGAVGRTTTKSRLLPLNGDRGVVVALSVVSAAIFLALLPIVNLQLAARPAFIPAILSSLLICCSLTGLILLGRFSVQRMPGLLILAAAYLFVAFTIAPAPEAVPGMFLSRTMFGSAAKGASWLVLREAGSSRTMPVQPVSRLCGFC